MPPSSDRQQEDDELPAAHIESHLAAINRDLARPNRFTSLHDATSRSIHWLVIAARNCACATVLPSRDHGIT